MTKTTILHTTVAREIDRILRSLEIYQGYNPANLEAHELSVDLTAAITLLLQHADDAKFISIYN